MSKKLTLQRETIGSLRARTHLRTGVDGLPVATVNPTILDPTAGLQKASKNLGCAPVKNFDSVNFCEPGWQSSTCAG